MEQEHNEVLTNESESICRNKKDRIQFPGEKIEKKENLSVITVS
jgi:hypothetical protein